MKEHHKIEHRNMVGPDSSCTSDTYITYTEGDLLLTNEMHTQCTNLNHALYGRTLDAGKMYRFNLILKPENRSKLSMSINFIGHPTHYTSSKDVLACHSFLLWSHSSFSHYRIPGSDKPIRHFCQKKIGWNRKDTKSWNIIKSMCWLIYTTLCHKDMIKSIYELALIRKRVRESKQVLKFARQGKCPADKATRRDINMSRETKNHKKKIFPASKNVCTSVRTRSANTFVIWIH